MAGKHTGWSDASGGPDGFGRFPRLDIAFREGVEGNPAANPHTAGTPEYLAYDAGSSASNYYEVAPGGLRQIVATAQGGSEYRAITTWASAQQPIGYNNGFATHQDAAFSFEAITLTGAVTSATLTTDRTVTESGTALLALVAESADNPAAWGAGHKPSDANPNWTLANVSVTTEAQWAAGFDVTAIVNELISSFGAGTRRLNFCFYSLSAPGAENTFVFGGTATYTLTIIP